jgi:transketolase
MRNAFINRLIALAEVRREIGLITGDLGFGVLDEFERRFPKQYINAGVAEQNMTALATGMAMEGHIMFTYSIGNFPTLRCLEQIRNDACYHGANVKIVSIGGGFSYGPLGMSHHATEDMAIMRALPGIVVCTPGTAFEASCAVDALVAIQGPAYLRLERAAPGFEDSASIAFNFGRARVLREGRSITLIAAGGIVADAALAADDLKKEGIDCRVLSIHCLKPIDKEAIELAARETGGIVTIEEGTILGGLGAAVCEICLESHSVPARFLRLGIPDQYVAVVGDQAYMRAEIGIDRAAIARKVRQLLAN